METEVQKCHNICIKMWNVMNFSVTLISRKISFGEFRIIKYPHFDKIQPFKIAHISQNHNESLEIVKII